MDRRILTRSLLGATATGIALPGVLPLALRAQTSSASPAASGNIRYADISGVAIALSPDGTMIAGVIDRETFAVWDAASFELVTQSEPLPELRILDDTSVTWSPNNDAIAWSLNALQLGRDSDIYVFDIQTAGITNLTREASGDEDAPSMLGNGNLLLDIDMFPSWSADGHELLFTRSPMGNDSPRETSLMRISPEGGEASQVALLSSTTSFLVSGPMTVFEDGSVLYGTWPPVMDDPDQGVFLVTSDGEVEGVSTGMLARGVPMMQITSVAPDARKASVVSLQNLARLDQDTTIWVELDLDTGIPTRFEDILPLPDGESGVPDALLAAPAFLTTGANGTGDLIGYIYVTMDSAYDTFALWHHDIASDETVSLGSIENSGPRASGVTRVPSVQIATDGIAALGFAGHMWLVRIDR